MQVRSKNKPATDIEFTLLDSIVRELNDFLGKMKSVKAKLDFIKIMRTQYKINFLSTQESVDNALQRSTNNLYTFFYDDKLKVEQPAIYDAHIAFLIQLSKDTIDESQRKFVIVDIDLHPQEKDAQREIKITWYNKMKLRSDNLLKDASKNASNNILRYITNYFTDIYRHLQLNNLIDSDRL